MEAGGGGGEGSWGAVLGNVIFPRFFFFANFLILRFGPDFGPVEAGGGAGGGELLSGAAEILLFYLV